MTNWYNKNSEIDIRFINLGSFVREVEKELTRTAGAGSAITIGVEERPYYPNRTNINTATRTTTSVIAAGHEFGLSNLPRRSFLELSARRFVKSNLQDIADRDYTYIKSFLKALTIKLYDTIMKCFLTGGFGTWKKLTREYKNLAGRRDPALIYTGQLMSAVYAQYEGFTVSGKQVGGFMQSHFYKLSDDGGKLKVDRIDTNIAAKARAQLEQKNVIETKTVEKKVKAKPKKIEENISREELINRLYAKKKKELGHIGFMSWLGDEEMEIDVMSTEEIRKRYGI